MKKMPKNAEIFKCEKCDFTCLKRSNWNTHILTLKHKNRTILNDLEPKNAENKYTCQNCNKTYKARNSLWYHEQKCNTKKNDQENDTINKSIDNKDELILMLIKENNEIQKQMIEVIKNGTNNTINTNSNNKTKFNLNFFLNETCKDAMNITDFVSSLKLQLTDLENVGKNGYVNGISNIIVKNLNALEVNKRPVHCSDLKREIMYVKDENKWEKEKEKLKTAVKKISYKNVLQIQKWQKEHPGCQYSHNNQNDEYLQILNESMGALTEEEKLENINKIIKNVAKEVVIEKEAE
jgi:hypothetical protein